CCGKWGKLCARLLPPGLSGGLVSYRETAAWSVPAELAGRGGEDCGGMKRNSAKPSHFSRLRGREPCSARRRRGPAESTRASRLPLQRQLALIIGSRGLLAVELLHEHGAPNLSQFPVGVPMQRK